MSFCRRTILLILLLPALSVAQEFTSLTPQAGLLLLRNGHMLQGQITRAGDNYIVTFGIGGEVKIAAKEVETQCADIEGAYDYKLRRLSGDGAGPHLDLAEWSLRHNLHRQCAEQLSLALATEPDNKRLEGIDRRLQLATQAPAPIKAKSANSTIVSGEQLEKTLRELPKGALERFSTIVQPILNNRCATSHCHGANSTSELVLLRPPAGIGSAQKFTQRNLYAVLQFVDRDEPANSALLNKPQAPHGGGTAAALDVRSRSQLQELQTWVEQLAYRKDAPTPATIDPQAAQLTTPLRATPGENMQQRTTETKHVAEVPAPWDATTPPKLGEPPKTPAPHGHHSPPQTPAPTAVHKPWQPRDPFDPEIFNRRYSPAKK
ncbi:hypothetical protein [Anatilimnocola floriformis]|uniref:hypothetical protein n=1 Tax=Anatilimnocola floriformis TaxID=2948575 RepID=UPI0020C5619E|nr:hypothetical protein [Anatilimnocola floriformis]